MGIFLLARAGTCFKRKECSIQTAGSCPFDLCSCFTKFRGSIVVSIPACHAGDPGSIPGLGVFFPCVFHHKKDPGNRSRTSDLEISVVAIYSLPLCQLSYTRTYGCTEVHSENESTFQPRQDHGRQKNWFALQTVGIEPTLLRTRALSVRLNRSAKSAILLSSRS